jgi:hypothetical protein
MLFFDLGFHCLTFVKGNFSGKKFVILQATKWTFICRRLCVNLKAHIIIKFAKGNQQNSLFEKCQTCSNTREVVISSKQNCNRLLFFLFCVFNKKKWILSWKYFDASAYNLCKCFQHTLLILMGNLINVWRKKIHFLFTLIIKTLTQPVFVWYE